MLRLENYISIQLKIMKYSEGISGPEIIMTTSLAQSSLSLIKLFICLQIVYLTLEFILMKQNDKDVTCWHLFTETCKNKVFQSQSFVVPMENTNFIEGKYLHILVCSVQFAIHKYSKHFLYTHVKYILNKSFKLHFL